MRVNLHLFAQTFHLLVARETARHDGLTCYLCEVRGLAGPPGEGTLPESPEYSEYIDIGRFSCVHNAPVNKSTSINFGGIDARRAYVHTEQFPKVSGDATYAGS